MIVIDRVIWQKVFIYLSIGRKIGNWKELESVSKYKIFSPIKWLIYFLMMILLSAVVNEKISSPLGGGALVAIGVVYAAYAFKVAKCGFLRAVEECKK